jgi:cyclophilin family peptidyl-prolyl cis-trans isomerase
MSSPEQPRNLSSAGEQQVQQWLADADAASKAEDWERTISLYRKALEFDRYLQGVEAKLQWALRMRDIENLYRQGKAKLDAGQYEAALVPLRKARLMFASHYKDVDDLIVQAQTALQKEKWEARPMARSAARKQQRDQEQRRTLTIIGAVVALMLLGLAIYFVLPLVTAGGSSNSGNPASSSGSASSSGAAAAIAPQQRNGMYKSAPAMTIDAAKSYRATIQTSKGNIVVDLDPKSAPQTVNNFVFLARDGFYNGLTFHRVEKNPPFVIQGGDPLGNGTGGPGYNIPPEIKLKHTKGAIAMARQSGPPQTTPSSGSQFYIALDDLPSLDNNYTVFGQTTPDTMSVVNQIAVGDVINAITIEEK